MTAEGHVEIQWEDTDIPFNTGWDALIPLRADPVMDQSAICQAAFIQLALYLTWFVMYALSILLFNYLIARPPKKQADKQGSRAAISIWLSSPLNSLCFVCPFSMVTSKHQRSDWEREGIISFKLDEALLVTGTLHMWRVFYERGPLLKERHSLCADKPPCAELGCFPVLRSCFLGPKSILFMYNIESKMWKNPPQKEGSKWLSKNHCQIMIRFPNK